MKVSYFTALCLLIGSFNLEAAPWSGWFAKKPVEKDPQIRALIVYDAPGVVFEVKGKYHLYDPVHNSHISTRFLGKRKWLQPLRDGLKWGEEFPGQHQLLVVPEAGEVTTTVDGIEYKGDLYIYDVEGKLSIVNLIDLEDFLAATLFPKVTGNEPEEYLSALAIAERTRLYASLKEPRSPFWNVDARDHAYYPGAISIRKQGPVMDAIRATRAMALVRMNNNGEYAPFFASWNDGTSKITLDEAKKLAEKGDHAAFILEKAFPGSFMRVFTTASD